MALTSKKVVTLQKFPHIFSVETVLGCNLSCPECAVGGKHVNRKYGYLKYDQFVHIADKIRGYCEYLYLHLWGEPMLNPDIFKMIEYANEFTRTNISTNANTLTRETAMRLACSGADIIVSIDGMTQGCYARYRQGGDVARALETLAWLAEYGGYNSSPGTFSQFVARIQDKLGLGAVKANIQPQYVVFEHNESEMKAFKEYCHSLGLAAKFKSPYLRKGSPLKNSSLAEFRRDIQSAPEIRKKAMRACTDIDNVFTILLDGRVVACCYDHNGITSFGNIFEQSVEEILASSSRKDFARALSDGRPPAFCLAECLMY